jgi:hypothetical protein
MSIVPLASNSFEPLELQFDAQSRAALQRMRDGVEHVFDQRPLPWLQSPVAVDILSSMSPVVVAR